MHKRMPQARAFANSRAKLTIQYQGRDGAHALEISPGLFGLVTSLLALVVLAYGAATGYLIFKDDLLRSALSGQARMQYAYEDRIAQLRAQIDRVASRQLIDQDTVESKLHELISRQVQLESRQVLVARLTEEAEQMGVKPTPPAGNVVQPDPTPTGAFQTFRSFPANAPQPGFAKPKPQPEGATPAQADDARAHRQAPPLRTSANQKLPAVLQNAQAAAQKLAARQMETLRGIEQAASTSARRFSAVLEQTGLDRARFAKALAMPVQQGSAVGGPLVPISNPEAAAFERSLVSARAHLLTTGSYSRVIRSLPLRRPLPAEFETTSTFGPRTDPFTRGMAMHTGLDFRAATGTPIRATAEGKVSEAGWSGGYGRMVEIDHGFGLTTRYAHMSAIEVAAGDVVKRGQVVGYVGSSGRSTGPHLHYEVRIDDDAADPMAFVRAGSKAGAK